MDTVIWSIFFSFNPGMLQLSLDVDAELARLIGFFFGHSIDWINLLIHEIDVDAELPFYPPK